MSEPELLFEQSLEGGLRYTEKRERAEHGKPVRRCALWHEFEDEPVSDLQLLEYRQRFGAVDVPVEGFGGVATRPKHRRRGYVDRLMRRAIERAGERVDALFLYGIENLYPKFGFVSCFCECEIELELRDAERARPSSELRELRADDVGAALRLYNREHATRPWTIVRQAAHWSGPQTATDWNAGESGVAVGRNGRLDGYAFLSDQSYGSVRELRVVEICAATAEAADGLVACAAERALARRQQRIVFLEPPDSTAGRALRRLGARVKLLTAADGEGMGRINRRASLVERLRPELARRAGRDDAKAVEALAAGRLYPDDRVLLPLLLGSHSWRDAADLGNPPPEKLEELARAWFTGHGPELSVPYTHRADRY